MTTVNRLQAFAVYTGTAAEVVTLLNTDIQARYPAFIKLMGGMLLGGSQVGVWCLWEREVVE